MRRFAIAGFGLLFAVGVKDKTALPDDVINRMGSEATITGKVHSNGGSTFLTVESVK